jgi:hypothetical protein
VRSTLHFCPDSLTDRPVPSHKNAAMFVIYAIIYVEHKVDMCEQVIPPGQIPNGDKDYPVKKKERRTLQSGSAPQHGSKPAHSGSLGACMRYIPLKGVDMLS